MVTCAVETCLGVAATLTCHVRNYDCRYDVTRRDYVILLFLYIMEVMKIPQAHGLED